MTTFYFTLTNPEAESLLKKEISERYPDLKMSYSRSGFITYKGEKAQVFNPYFSRLSGLCLGKFKKDELNFERAWVWKRDESFEIPPDLQTLSDESYYKVGEKVTLIMMVGADEYWVGEYILSRRHFGTPGEVSSILKKEVPSRAYYKMAEAIESFDIMIENDDVVLELGSAPGGASLFLLDQGAKVIGVDPAEMDKEILKNKNFKHYRAPFETIREENLHDKIDWLVSDINLPPTVVMKEIERFLGFMKPKGLVITLKINQERYMRMIPHFHRTMTDFGYKHVELKYFPSHRQEIALIALAP